MGFENPPGLFTAVLRMKMYILVKESVPVGFGILAAAHASLAAYLRFKDTPEVTEWLAGPFYKVICKVNDREFEAAKTCEDHVVLTIGSLSWVAGHGS